MRDGTCARCGGDEVYAAANGLAIGGSTQAAVHQHIEPGFRGMRARTMTDGLWQFVCASCGHVEMFLLDEQAIAFIRQGWIRVAPQPPPPAA